MLSTYVPEHIWFTKDWRPRKVRPPRQLNNDHGFFDDLPASLLEGRKVKRSLITNKLILDKEMRGQQRAQEDYADEEMK